MGDVSQAYFSKYRYTLLGALGFKRISEPKGWGSDNKVFKRSTDVHGVFVNLSKNLEFYKGDEKNDGGYDWLKQTYDIYGINATVILLKEEDVSGVWEEDYRGYLDYSTYVRSGQYIKLMFNESGLYEKIKARRSEDLELDRTDTMDGDVIPSLTKNIASLEGRDILYTNEFQRTEEVGDYPSGDNDVFIGYELPTDEDITVRLGFRHGLLGQYEAICVPITVVAIQDGSAQSVTDYNIEENENSYANQDTTSVMFYANSADDVSINIEFDVELQMSEYGEKPNTIKLDLVRFKDGVSYVFDSYETLVQASYPSANQIISYSGSGSYDVEVGTSFALAVHSYRSAGDDAVFVNVNKASATIYDDSFYEPSQTNFILPYEALERILLITTNETDILKSSILGRTDTTPSYTSDGFASLMGLTPGFWVRNFNDEPLTTSFDDFTDSFGMIAQTGYGIERIGNKEYIRYEHIKYFYREIVTMPINDKPVNIERSVASDYFYSGIEMGYSKPSGDTLYEEAQGLDEYNIKNTYTSVISRVENKFEQESKYRADGYGKEFARRKPKIEYPEEDTRYDQDVMIMDLKRGQAEVFEERKWADDFVVPTPFDKYTTGVYSPSTAVNLRLSPMNTLNRWGFWINGGFAKYPEDYVRYSSSVGNSALTTQAIGSDVAYTENGKILNSTFDKPLFNPELITFEYPIDRDMLKTIKGTIVVDGETIMNYYGLVSFINEDNQMEFGYLMSAEPNGEGKWELLSSTKLKININDIDSGESVLKDPYNLGAVDVSVDPNQFNYNLNTNI